MAALLAAFDDWAKPATGRKYPHNKYRAAFPSKPQPSGDPSLDKPQPPRDPSLGKPQPPDGPSFSKPQPSGDETRGVWRQNHSRQTAPNTIENTNVNTFSEPARVLQIPKPGNPDPITQRAEALAGYCNENGVTGATPDHPTVISWARDGVTVQEMMFSVTEARDRRGAQAGPVPLRYLERLVPDMLRFWRRRQPMPEYDEEPLNGKAVKFSKGDWEI